MKRAIGQVLLGASLVSALLAIWSPVGDWWQWLATAVVLLFLGAMLLGTADGYAEGGEVPMVPLRDGEILSSTGYAEGGEVTTVPLRDGEILSSTGDADLDERLNARPTYGKRKEEDR